LFKHPHSKEQEATYAKINIDGYYMIFTILL